MSKKSETSTYMCWRDMMRRCYDPRRVKHYPRYGGRGIKVCKRWHVYDAFHHDMGDKPFGLTLDRKNNDGNYSKRNCRWATYAEQAKNRHSRGPDVNGRTRDNLGRFV